MALRPEPGLAVDRKIAKSHTERKRESKRKRKQRSSRGTFVFLFLFVIFLYVFWFPAFKNMQFFLLRSTLRWLDLSVSGININPPC
jgi:hypothetical protein